MSFQLSAQAITAHTAITRMSVSRCSILPPQRGSLTASKWPTSRSIAMLRSPTFGEEDHPWLGNSPASGISCVAPGGDSDDPTAKAQDVMYEAWEQTTARSRIALARKALSISPLCADAYVLLAEEAARTVEEARDFYAKGVEAGELALGPEGFKEYEGQFWGFLETRPYMRARAGLASALLKLGDEDGAISHFREMLRLNPNDNQGIRYLLAGCLLRRGDDSALKELLASYEDEGSAFWLYTRALLAFREGGEGDERAAALAREAWAANEHVPAILAGTKPPEPSESDYITLGDPDEATEYVT